MHFTDRRAIATETANGRKGVEAKRSAHWCRNSGRRFMTFFGDERRDVVVYLSIALMVRLKGPSLLAASFICASASAVVLSANNGDVGLNDRFAPKD
jgi:hypothetical protein